MPEREERALAWFEEEEVVVVVEGPRRKWAGEEVVE